MTLFVRTFVLYCSPVFEANTILCQWPSLLYYPDYRDNFLNIFLPLEKKPFFFLLLLLSSNVIILCGLSGSCSGSISGSITESSIVLSCLVSGTGLGFGVVVILLLALLTEGLDAPTWPPALLPCKGLLVLPPNFADPVDGRLETFSWSPS